MSEETYTPITIQPSEVSEDAPARTSEEIKEARERAPKGLPGVKAELEVEEKLLVLIEEPFLIQHLGIDKKLLKINPDGLSQKTNIIDLWIKNEIKRREWKPNVKSYIEVLDEVKEKLGVSDNMTPLTQVNKMFDILEKAWEDKKLQKKIGMEIIPSFSGF